MRFDEIIQRLKIMLGANIAQQKDLFARKKNELQRDDDALQFIELFSKSTYTLDDINDMLICYSDHYLTVEDVLDLAIKNNVLLYDEEQYGVLFGVKNAVLLFLLSQSDKNIALQTLKCFSYDKLGFKRSESIEEAVGLNIGDTLYDFYLLIEDIKKIENLEDKKRKIIALMALIDSSFFDMDFKKIGIKFDDIENFFQYFEDNGRYLDGKNARSILNTQLAFEHRILGNEELYNKVREEYKKYSQKHLNFRISDFISYYNNTFNDNFNEFYFNISENIVLNEDLLLKIISSYGFNYFVVNNLGLGEYASKYSNFQYSTCFYLNSNRNRSAEYEERYQMRNETLTKYANVIERLKQPIDYTFTYFVDLNVLKKYSNEFTSIIDWYCENQPDFFGFDVRKSNVVQRKNTFEAILAESKKAMARNFKNRKKIHASYYDEIVKYIGNKYISKTDWNKEVAKFEIDYYYEKSINNIKILLECLTKGENVYAKAKELGITDEIKFYFDAICTKMPELIGQITFLKQSYDEEESKAMALIEVENRKQYADECSEILARFLAKGYKSKESFLEDEKMSETTFEKVLLVVEENNFPLYLEFMNKYNSLKSQRYAVLMKTVDYVLNALVNGVEENGVIRPFNFMDYSLLTKMPFDQFAVLVVNSKKLNNTNIRQFRQFEKLVKGYRLASRDVIFNEKLIVRLNDTMHEVTASEKELALKFLRFKGLSNYYVLYKIALTKVLHGEITHEMLDALQGAKEATKKLA